MKHCRICNVEKPTSEFNKQKSTADGLQSKCRACQAALWKKWVDAGRPKRKPAFLVIDGVEHKRCPKCKIEKPLSEYNKCTTIRGGVQSACRPCQNDRVNNWNKTHREKTREIDRARYQRDREKRLAASKQYRLDNIDARRAHDRRYGKTRYAADPSYCLEKTKRWVKQNPHKVKLLQGRGNAARRARINKSQGKHTKEQRKELCALYSHLCVYCRSPVMATHMDHVTPLARGGCNHVENLVPACRFCNLSKGKQTLLEFLVSRASRAGLL